MDENRKLTEEELDQVVGGGQSGGQEGTFCMYKCSNQIVFPRGNTGECAQYFLSNFPNAPCPREGCGCTDSTQRILIEIFI